MVRHFLPLIVLSIAPLTGCFHSYDVRETRLRGAAAESPEESACLEVLANEQDFSNRWKIPQFILQMSTPIIAGGAGATTATLELQQKTAGKDQPDPTPYSITTIVLSGTAILTGAGALFIDKMRDDSSKQMSEIQKTIAKIEERKRDEIRLRKAEVEKIDKEAEKEKDEAKREALLRKKADIEVESQVGPNSAELLLTCKYKASAAQGKK